MIASPSADGSEPSAEAFVLPSWYVLIRMLWFNKNRPGLGPVSPAVGICGVGCCTGLEYRLEPSRSCRDPHARRALRSLRRTAPSWSTTRSRDSSNTQPPSRRSENAASNRASQPRGSMAWSETFGPRRTESMSGQHHRSTSAWHCTSPPLGDSRTGVPYQAASCRHSGHHPRASWRVSN